VTEATVIAEAEGVGVAEYCDAAGVVHAAGDCLNFLVVHAHFHGAVSVDCVSYPALTTAIDSEGPKTALVVDYRRVALAA
jgi:hypothetical protein